MTEQEKQVLAGLCRIEIKRWKSAADSNPNMRYMVELMDVALASLMAEIGWIKCSERMPECDQWDHAAVIASEGRNSFIAYYSKHDCKFLDEPFGESVGNKITHWMPLPAPPEE